MGGTGEKTEYASNGLLDHRIGDLPKMEYKRSLPSSDGRTSLGVRKGGLRSYGRSVVSKAKAVGGHAASHLVYPSGSSSGSTADACRLSLWPAAHRCGWDDGKRAG